MLSPVIFFGPVSCPTPVLLILLFDQVFAAPCSSFLLAWVLLILERVHLWGCGSCFCLWQPEHFSSFSYLFSFLPFGVTGRGHIWANTLLTLGWATSSPQDPKWAFAYSLPCSKVPRQWFGSYSFALLIYLMYLFILDVAIYLSWIVINIIYKYIYSILYIYFIFLFHFFSSACFCCWCTVSFPWWDK